MNKIAFLFAGQGAQKIGMGKDIVEHYKEADKVFQEGSEALEFDVKKMIFDGDEENLKITENTQPAILITSIACYEVLKSKGIKPDIVAGLSLGEYSAHVVAGTFSFSDAVKLVRKRGRFMQEAVPIGVGTMAAIIGLAPQQVIECCENAKQFGIVEPANFNCPGQIVIAGEIEAVENVCSIAKEKGAKRAIVLPVSAPFHCSMLKPAGEKLEKELQKIKINSMNIPVIANVNAEYIKSKEQAKELLVKQVSNCVRWEDSINKMIEEGVNTFIEIGPGKALSGFVKRIDKTVKIYNVEDIESLNNTLNEMEV